LTKERIGLEDDPHVALAALAKSGLYLQAGQFRRGRSGEDWHPFTLSTPFYLACIENKLTGEVRFSWGPTPTDYTYTGQYSNMDDIGLMYYGARWYDPQLGRWNQPDTLIPQSQGTQAWDRMAYVNNDAVNHTDPSGRTAYSDDGICIGDCTPSEPQLDLNDVKDPEGRDKPRSDEKKKYPEGYIKPAWENYQKIWWWLMYHGFNWAIDPHTGKIRDFVVMAFIIFGEFHNYKNDGVDEYRNSSMATYNAALGANIQCASGGDGCTLAEQIGWLSDVPSWYGGNDFRNLKAGATNWQDYLGDARKAMDGIDSNMWMWGNATASRSDGVNYYAPYEYNPAPWFVVHP
jgi:RHS repeat-associated protein